LYKNYLQRWPDALAYTLIRGVYQHSFFTILDDFDGALKQVQDDKTAEARDLSTLQPFNFSTHKIRKSGTRTSTDDL
jgi:hypothetical protein